MNTILPEAPDGTSDQVSTKAGEVHISRGASACVIAYRERLAGDPDEWRRLDAALPNEHPDDIETFEAMRRMFAEELRKPEALAEKPASFRELLSRTERLEDGGTRDPALWDAWLRSVATATAFPDPDNFKVVIRATIRMRPTGEGGRRSPVLDGYRGNLAFGPETIDPARWVQYGSVIVFEDVDRVAPGEQAMARAYVMLPVFLPLKLGADTKVRVMEGSRIVGEGIGVERFRDRTGRPLGDANVEDMKMRPLDPAWERDTP